MNPGERGRANCSEPCSEAERALLNCVPGWAQMSHWKAAISVFPLRWLALFLSALKIGRGWFISVTLCLWGCQDISPLKAKKIFSCLLASHKFKACWCLLFSLFFYHPVCVSSEWCIKGLLLAALHMKVQSSASERPRCFFAVLNAIAGVLQRCSICRAPAASPSSARALSCSLIESKFLSTSSWSRALISLCAEAPKAPNRKVSEALTRNYSYSV